MGRDGREIIHVRSEKTEGKSGKRLIPIKQQQPEDQLTMKQHSVIQMNEEARNEAKINKNCYVKAATVLGNILMICGFIAMALYFTRSFNGFFDFDYSILIWVFFHASGALFLAGAYIWNKKYSPKSLSAIQTTCVR